MTHFIAIPVHCGPILSQISLPEQKWSFFSFSQKPIFHPEVSYLILQRVPTLLCLSIWKLLNFPLQLKILVCRFIIVYLCNCSPVLVTECPIRASRIKIVEQIPLNTRLRLILDLHQNSITSILSSFTKCSALKFVLHNGFGPIQISLLSLLPKPPALLQLGCSSLRRFVKALPCPRFNSSSPLALSQPFFLHCLYWPSPGSSPTSSLHSSETWLCRIFFTITAISSSFYVDIWEHTCSDFPILFLSHYTVLRFLLWH